MELGNQKGCRAVENCAHRRARSGGVSSVEKNKSDRQKAINFMKAAPIVKLHL